MRRFSRAPRLRPSWPTALWWSLCFLAAIALLTALGSSVGMTVHEGNGFWRSLHRTVAKTSVALSLAIAILTFLAYAWRRIQLERLAWRPGRIQVPDFTVSNVTSVVSPQQLTDAFRNRLAGLRLASSTAAPAAQPESNFLDVLGAGKVGSSDILATLLTLLRAATPSFAYELRGVVTEQPAEQHGSPPAYRVSLQITRLPNQGGRS